MLALETLPLVSDPHTAEYSSNVGREKRVNGNYGIKRLELKRITLQSNFPPVLVYQRQRTRRSVLNHNNNMECVSRWWSCTTALIGLAMDSWCWEGEAVGAWWWDNLFVNIWRTVLSWQLSISSSHQSDSIELFRPNCISFLMVYIKK